MGQSKWQGNEFNGRNGSDTAWTNYALVAAMAGKRYYITDILISCGATGRNFQLLDGSGGTVLWSQNMAASTSYPISLATPIRVPTVGNGIYLTSAGASVGSFVAVNGFWDSI